MKYDADNIGVSYDDTITTCSECGAMIDDDFIMPIEGKFYCDDCFNEEFSDD